MKRPFRFYVICLMLFVLLCSVYGVQANAQMNSTIRVWLNRLKLEDTLRINVQGTYMLQDGSALFSDGAELTVVLREGRLVLHTQQMAVVMGREIKLIRCKEGS